MKRKEENLYLKFNSLLSSNNASGSKLAGGKRVAEEDGEVASHLPAITSRTSANPLFVKQIDPLAPLILSEKTLLNSLSLLPILKFYRRPINPISTSPTPALTLPGQKSTILATATVKNEIFGSVSEKEILIKFSEYGILVEEGLGRLVNATKGGEEVENSRIKNLGKYKC